MLQNTVLRCELIFRYLKAIMSSSETDDSDDELDNLEEDDMYDDGYDDIPDLDDTDHLTTLFNSVLSTGITGVAAAVSRADSYSAHTIRSAFGLSSPSSSNRSASASIFEDSIHSYVKAPGLFGSPINGSPYFLSIDPTINQLNSNPLASDKLFVGNISYTVTCQELKAFFVQLNFNVKDIDLPNNRKKVYPSFCNRFIEPLMYYRVVMMAMPL